MATQLAYALENAGLQIIQVYSRTVKSAQVLADELYTDFTSDINAISLSADLYIISLSDDAIFPVSEKLSLTDKLVVHTSGSVSLDAILKTSNNTGVFYPLQTMSRSRKVDFSNIPLCIEANNEENETILFSLANLISKNVRRINSKERRILHLAAVFANNFPNFMYSISEQILEDNNLDFNLLRPLITETASKIQKMDPRDGQTGPAKRGDEKIMKQHLDMLNNYPGFKEVYKLISAEIQKNQE